MTPDQFQNNIDRSAGPDGCWPWMRAKDRRDYGRVRISLPGEPDRTALAHRLSWELANGRRAQPDMYVCHHCDNPPCCNPAHLYEGTPTQNALDTRDRKRSWEMRSPSCRNGHPWTPETTVYGKFKDRPQIRRCAICMENERPKNIERCRRNRERRKREAA